MVIAINLLQRIKFLINPVKAISEGGAPKDLLNAFYTVSSSLSPPERTEWGLLKVYSKSPFLRRSVSKIAKSFAAVEWRCYVTRDENGKAYRDFKLQKANFDNRQKLIKKAIRSQSLEELENHPLTKLLENFNPWLDGNLCRQLISIYYDLVGNSFNIIERDNRGMPIEIWPIPSTWVLQTPGFNQRFFKIEVGNQIFDIPESEVIWIKDPDPLKPYGRGTGIAKALADELDTDEYAAKYIKKFFYNDAKPPIIVSPKGDQLLDRFDAERLEKEWREKAAGFWNAYKPFFVTREIEIKELAQTFQSMQLVELRNWEKKIVGELWGIPPEILGELENSNRATIESADYILAKHVLVPRLEVVRNILQEKLANQFDEKLILDYVSPIPDDKEFKKQVMKDHPYAFTIDEIRDMVDMDPLPDDQGQVRPIPPTVIFSTEYSQPVENFEDLEEFNEDEEKQLKTIKKELGNEIVYEIIKAVDPEHISYEVHPRYLAIIEQLGKQTLEQLGLQTSFNLLNPRVQDYIKTQVGLKIKQINQTTIEALRETLLEGIKAGEGIPQLAKRISSVFEEAKGYRSKVIARTETMNAVNYSTFEAYRQSGVVQEKEWIATPDERVRDWHLDMDGQRRALNAMFTSGLGNNTLHPGGFGIPEEDIQCRCTLVAVINGKTAVDVSTKEKRYAYWKTMDAQAFAYERAMKAAYIKGFQKQQLAVMDILKKWG